MNGLVGIVLAGGKGERLHPLTKERAKPSVPFGGKYRIIDFIMNSLVNSDVRKIKVLVQSRSQSLIEHVSRFWTSDGLRGRYIDVVPAQMKIAEEWYKGTADAVYQNLDEIKHARCELVGIFAGDSIFKLDVGKMKAFHKDSGAEFTICCMVLPVEEAAQRFGVLEVNERSRVIGFEEKPEIPKEIPGRPGMCLVSMGNYIAGSNTLNGALEADAKMEWSNHDFGRDIIPWCIRNGIPVYAYDFASQLIPGEKRPYWRDVGTIRSFWEANMDLRNIEPELNLYNREWPLKTTPDYAPPAKLVFDGRYNNSIISGGVIISGADVIGSVLGREIRVERSSRIIDSVLFDRVFVSEGCKIRNSIIDKNVVVPPFTNIGWSEEEDKERGLSVIDGITVVPKNFIFN